MMYEVVIHDLGLGENQIINYVQSYQGCDQETAYHLLQKLPLVIRKTPKKMEAFLIKETLKSFGASVEIRELDSSNTNENYSNNEDYYDRHREENKEHNKSPLKMWKEEGRGHEGPIIHHQGCLSVIIIGFLIFITGVFALSQIIG